MSMELSFMLEMTPRLCKTQKRRQERFQIWWEWWTTYYIQCLLSK